MSFLKRCAEIYHSTNLIVRILCGIALGVILALLFPGAIWISLLGTLFVGALKAIAPVLVFTLVLSSLAVGGHKLDRKFGFVIFLYMLSTFLAAVVAVVASMMFPQTLILKAAEETTAIPKGLGEVMQHLLLNVIGNPIQALQEANYIGILFWACLLGIAFKEIATAAEKSLLNRISEAVGRIVRWVISLAPFGILGIVFEAVSTNGTLIFKTYGSLILLLVGCMLFVALVMNPLLVFLCLRRNPYPLIFKCLRGSGLTAFFTRSSAANIPVNMALCEELRLNKDLYSVSIPLGATINMDGAAITITIMTLAAAHTTNIQVNFWTALVLSLLSTLAACGASGVAGGSLLLIPLACSLFNISNDVAMQVVAVGFVIGVIQDSCETAINSASDVIFAATAEYRTWLKNGRPLPWEKPAESNSPKP